MATIQELKNASEDAELRSRFEVAITAIGLNLPDAAARQLVWDNFGRIVGTQIPGAQQNVADVYTYARNIRNDALASVPQTPGSNPAAVTDENIKDVLRHLFLPDTEA